MMSGRKNRRWYEAPSKARMDRIAQFLESLESAIASESDLSALQLDLGALPGNLEGLCAEILSQRGRAWNEVPAGSEAPQFRSAMALAVNRRLHYAEGIAGAINLPYRNEVRAWCVDDAGVAHDPEHLTSANRYKHLLSSGLGRVWRISERARARSLPAA